MLLGWRQRSVRSILLVSMVPNNNGPKLHTKKKKADNTTQTSLLYTTFRCRLCYWCTIVLHQELAFGCLNKELLQEQEVVLTFYKIKIYGASAQPVAWSGQSELLTSESVQEKDQSETNKPKRNQSSSVDYKKKSWIRIIDKKGLDSNTLNFGKIRWLQRVGGENRDPSARICTRHIISMYSNSNRYIYKNLII
jgi:hypothetical protein